MNIQLHLNFSKFPVQLQENLQSSVHDTIQCIDYVLRSNKTYVLIGWHDFHGIYKFVGRVALAPVDAIIVSTVSY